MTRQLTPRITAHVAFYERNHHSVDLHDIMWPSDQIQTLPALIRPLDQFWLKENTDFSIKLEKQETFWYTWSAKKKKCVGLFSITLLFSL